VLVAVILIQRPDRAAREATIAVEPIE